MQDSTQDADLVLDVNQLTLGDLEYLEDELGEDWLERLSQKPTTKDLIHVTWRILLGSDPEATLDDARKVKIASIYQGDDEDDDESHKQRDGETPPNAALA